MRRCRRDRQADRCRRRPSDEREHRDLERPRPSATPPYWSRLLGDDAGPVRRGDARIRGRCSSRGAFGSVLVLGGTRQRLLASPATQATACGSGASSAGAAVISSQLRRAHEARPADLLLVGGLLAAVIGNEVVHYVGGALLLLAPPSDGTAHARPRRDTTRCPGQRVASGSTRCPGQLQWVSVERRRSSSSSSISPAA